MKLIFKLVLLVNIICLGTTSCTKEQISSPDTSSVGNNTNSYVSPEPLNLVANDWQQDQNGLYVHTFYNILSPATGYKINVYLLAYGQELSLNRFILFMGGQLWATYSTTDIKIFFRISGALPFTSLNIKVVTE
jgi:hypothetical protein